MEFLCSRYKKSSCNCIHHASFGAHLGLLSHWLHTVLRHNNYYYASLFWLFTHIQQTDVTQSLVRRRLLHRPPSVTQPSSVDSPTLSLLLQTSPESVNFATPDWSTARPRVGASHGVRQMETIVSWCSVSRSLVKDRLVLSSTNWRLLRIISRWQWYKGSSILVN